MQVEDTHYSSFGNAEYEYLLKASSSIPILLLFSSTTSGNNFIVENQLKEIVKELGPGKIKLYKVEVKPSMSYPIQINIENTPIWVLIKDKEIMNIIQGLLPKGKVRQIIEEIIE